MSTHFQAVTPLFNIIKAGTDTTVYLPGPTQEPVAPEGLMFLVVDDKGTAAGTNIAISGPIAGGTSGTPITTAYGSALFIWIGNTYVQK